MESPQDQAALQSLLTEPSPESKTTRIESPPEAVVPQIEKGSSQGQLIAAALGQVSLPTRSISEDEYEAEKRKWQSLLESATARIDALRKIGGDHELAQVVHGEKFVAQYSARLASLEDRYRSQFAAPASSIGIESSPDMPLASAIVGISGGLATNEQSPLSPSLSSGELAAPVLPSLSSGELAAPVLPSLSSGELAASTLSGVQAQGVTEPPIATGVDAVPPMASITNAPSASENNLPIEYAPSFSLASIGTVNDGSPTEFSGGTGFDNQYPALSMMKIEGSPEQSSSIAGELGTTATSAPAANQAGTPEPSDFSAAQLSHEHGFSSSKTFVPSAGTFSGMPKIEQGPNSSILLGAMGELFNGMMGSGLDSGSLQSLLGGDEGEKKNVSRDGNFAGFGFGGLGPLADILGGSGGGGDSNVSGNSELLEAIKNLTEAVKTLTEKMGERSSESSIGPPEYLAAHAQGGNAGNAQVPSGHQQIGPTHNDLRSVVDSVVAGLMRR